jgi:hypothetical protein
VPAVTAAPPLRRDGPGQAVLLRGVEGLLRPPELGDGEPSARPLPHSLFVDVVAGEPEFGAATARARHCSEHHIIFRFFVTIMCTSFWKFFAEKFDSEAVSAIPSLASAETESPWPRKRNKNRNLYFQIML